MSDDYNLSTPEGIAAYLYAEAKRHEHQPGYAGTTWTLKRLTDEICRRNNIKPEVDTHE